MPQAPCPAFERRASHRSAHEALPRSVNALLLDGGECGRGVMAKYQIPIDPEPTHFAQVGELIADVLAVKGDPLKDLGALEQVRFVMKEGRVVLDARAGEGQAEGAVR